MPKEKIPRSKWWTVVTYSESMPDNFIDVVEKIAVPCVMSPEHDKDIKEDGTIKKNHFHWLIRFDSLKSAEQVIRDFCIPMGAPKYAEIVHSPYGTYKYLTHENCIDKVKYDSCEIIPFNGFTEDMISQVSDIENYDNLKIIINFAYENNITSFSELVACCLYDEKLDVNMFPYLVKNAYFVNSCLKTR